MPPVGKGRESHERGHVGVRIIGDEVLEEKRGPQGKACGAQCSVAALPEKGLETPVSRKLANQWRERT